MKTQKEGSLTSRNEQSDTNTSGILMYISERSLFQSSFNQNSQCKRVTYNLLYERISKGLTTNYMKDSRSRSIFSVSFLSPTTVTPTTGSVTFRDTDNPPISPTTESYVKGGEDHTSVDPHQ